MLGLELHAGRANALIDVAGLRVGHDSRIGDGYLTGSTVVLAPEGGMVAGVDVRGGGPGTRETDLLAPTASVERVHSVVLTGGSAYGLAAASGVANGLGAQGVGLPVGPNPGEVVPLVPSAVIFDLGRGGDFRARPDESFGSRALAAAQSTPEADMTACGVIGAGTGAVAGGLKGGIGQASAVLPDGSTVAALVVANAMGSLIDPGTGLPWGSGHLLTADGPLPTAPTETERGALAHTFAMALKQGLAGMGEAGEPVRNTTIGVIATDMTLTKAQCTKLAAVGHDGLARAVNPIHTLFDGDTLFGLSTATRAGGDVMAYQMLLVAAADVVTRAMVRALLAAHGVDTPGGTWRSYAEIAPSACAS